MSTCHYCIAHHGPAIHKFADGRERRWEPMGPIVVIFMPEERRRGRRGAEDNVQNWGKGGLSGRLFVGLNVGPKPTYDIEQVVRATRDFQIERGKSPNASFIAQKGIYTSPNQSVVTEDSVQIIVFASTDDKDAFRGELLALAKHLRRLFRQEAVIVELQERGITQQLLNVTAGRPDPDEHEQLAEGDSA